MAKDMKKVLDNVLEKISLTEEEISEINEELEGFLSKIESNIKKFKIDVEIFVGGSYAKGTLIRKKTYDVDIFLRFNKRYSGKDYSKLSKKVLSGIKKMSVSHGSRDYFKAEINPKLFFELVPVKRIKSPKEAENVTDLSYSHVKYVKNRIKNRKIIDGIKLAKAFCYATRTYGAESYIKGFSGYSLELLVYRFGSFEKFLKALSKDEDKKIIIDMEQHYKKGDVLLDMNGSKLDSPIILVDPTYKERNALAGLSEETFAKFRKNALLFLKNPSEEFFDRKKINFSGLISKNKKNVVLIELRTTKEEGDVAGTKLLKFFNHLTEETSKYFKILGKDFEYNGDKTGKGYLILKSRGEVVLTGPKIDDKDNLTKFKKEHKNIFIKNGRIYSRKKIDFQASQFINKWSQKNKKKMKEMSISEIKVD